MTLRASGILTVLTMTSMLPFSQSLAAGEVYGALEKDTPSSHQDVQTFLANDPIEKPTKKSTSSAKKRKTTLKAPVSLDHQIEQPEAEVAEIKKQPPKSTEEASFDAVPPDQIDGIAQRLKLVEQLIRKHSRAYDYRSHTLKELESILSQLDQNSQPNTESSTKGTTSI